MCTAMLQLGSMVSCSSTKSMAANTAATPAVVGAPAGKQGMRTQEIISLLIKARNLLHPVSGEVSNYDVTLAHDYIDMVVDELVDANFKQKQYFSTHDELSLQMYEDEERFYQELMDEPSAADMEYFEDCKYFNPWI